MNNNNMNDLPTQEECDLFFAGLPPLASSRGKPSVFPADLNVLADPAEDDDIGKISKEAPAIIAFSDGVSEQNREAVMLGVEFAETVASNKVDIDQDAVQWLTEYARAMRIAGWLTVGGHEYGSYTSSDKSLTMDSVVLELISAVAGPNKASVLALLEIVLDKLQKDESLMRLFEGNSKKGSLARFRIMPCIESSAGTPITYLLSMHCVYKSSSGGALFWKWSTSSLSINRLVKGVQFNKATFERNRERILKHLEGSADDFFNGLN
ncbi:hypothetical protein [Pseudomonas ovata]|uniref:hypothetical protein n=1 Tax=Pseudomonas ovata TaxID=1839709 RepID=UPI000D68F4DC|nr:hypothetical protein [Pseudomonas ovata]